MENLNSSESQKWPIILWMFTENQSKQVIEALNELPEGEMKEKLLAKCLKINLSNGKGQKNSKENYESFKPEGFEEYAPLKVKFYRKSLAEHNEIDLMKHFKKNLAYKANGKISLLLFGFDIDESLINKFNQKDYDRDGDTSYNKILSSFKPGFNPKDDLNTFSAVEQLGYMTGYYTLE